MQKLIAPAIATLFVLVAGSQLIAASGDAIEEVIATATLSNF